MRLPAFAERLPAGDAILILDAQRRVVWCGEFAATLFGRERAELADMPLDAILEGAPQEGDALVQVLRADGRRIATRARVESWRASGGRSFIVRLAGSAEQKYRELANIFAESQRFAHVGSFSINPETRHMRWSDELYRIFDIEPGSGAMDIESMIARVVPEDREALAAALETALRGESGLDLRFRIAADRERVVRAVGRISLAEQSAPCLIGSVLDVTADDEASRQRVELTRELDETKRMTSLGRVAATMAHEFNNVLAGIGSFAEYLTRRAPDDDMRRVASHIGKAIRRGKTVTDEILRYTRAKPPALAVVDVHAWLEAFAPEAGALTGGRAIVKPGPLRLIRGDVAQLNQVLVNLLINARDASPSDAPIVLSAATAKRDETVMLDLAVIDQGTGIPPEIRDRIFEPLFTTKRSGTGLGLPVVDQIVRAHDGVVRVRSEMGRGTEFHVLIPLHEGAEVSLSGPGSVLVADDDEAFAGAVVAGLESAGIRARAVHRGGDVLAALEEEVPDALALDVKLPDVRGTELYRAIADRWPDLRVVFISGQRSADLEPLLRQPHLAFLEKPFSIDDLLALLRRILA